MRKTLLRASQICLKNQIHLFKILFVKMALKNTTITNAVFERMYLILQYNLRTGNTLAANRCNTACRRSHASEAMPDRCFAVLLGAF